MTAPPRYDPIPTSCVNSEVVRFNRQLKKRMKMYNNVKILETDLEGEYFTKHGLHWNSSGKEHIALKLAAVVKSVFNKKKVFSVCLQRKEDPAISHQDRKINYLNTSNNKEVMVSQLQFSNSPKKNSVDYKNYPQQSIYQTTIKEQLLIHSLPKGKGGNLH
jgi:hypothetical protein